MYFNEERDYVQYSNAASILLRCALHTGPKATNMARDIRGTEAIQAESLVHMATLVTDRHFHSNVPKEREHTIVYEMAHCRPI